HYNMGLVQSALGRLDSAAAHLGTAIELKPDLAEAHMDLGTVLKRQGRPDEAAACYRRAIALRPAAAQIHYNLGNLHAEQGQLAEAVAGYQQAVRLAPAVAMIRNNLGTALLRQNNLVGAVVEFQQALRSDPKAIEASQNIGRVIEQIGSWIKAGASGEAKTLFVHCVENLRIIPDDIELRPLMVEALSEPWGRPSDLLGVGTAVLKKHPGIGAAIERAARTWPKRLPAWELFGHSERAATSADE